MIEIIGFEDCMNKPQLESITLNYEDRLENMITPKHLIFALFLAEGYREDGFTLDGFIEGLKKTIADTVPSYNIKLSDKINKELNDIKLFTDVAGNIISQAKSQKEE